MKNVPKTSRLERHLCFSHYSNYQYFPLLFSISIPISISKFPKSSISISKSIFWRCKFQYQYQNQYFEIVIFNIKININTSKILTFQNFSKFCAMSATKSTWWVTKHAGFDFARSLKKHWNKKHFASLILFLIAKLKRILIECKLARAFKIY